MANAGRRWRRTGVLRGLRRRAPLQWLARISLALLVVLSGVHWHADFEVAPAWSVHAAADDDGHSDGGGAPAEHGDCVICQALAMAATGLLPTPAAVRAPLSVADRRGVKPVVTIMNGRGTCPFEARGPPLASLT